MIPVSLEQQLVPGPLEFAIQTLVEDRMEMGRFADRYQNDEKGRMTYDPKILLKVVLLLSLGIDFLPEDGAGCRENVTFMALACGQRPDHCTITAFVSLMEEETKVLFGDVLLVWEESGLLGCFYIASLWAECQKSPHDFLRGILADLDLMLKMGVGVTNILLKGAGFQVDIAKLSGRPILGQTEIILSLGKPLVLPVRLEKV
jgi:hypothetical protein